MAKNKIAVPDDISNKCRKSMPVRAILNAEATVDQQKIADRA